MSELQNLHDVDWVAVPNAPYVIKYLFESTGYNILISNLVFIYGEKLQEKDVQKRFYKLNPFVEMKSQVILENLKKSLEKSLKENSDLTMKLEENKLNLTLLFPAAHVKCSFDINMDLLPAEQVMNYIICPTIFNAFLSQQKVMELQKRTSSSEDAAEISKSVLNPAWLTKGNVPSETVLEYFLKIQNYYRRLCTENNKTYNSKKEKSESISVSTVSPKKCKIEESSGIKSFNIKFEDNEENISIKKEEDDAPSQEIQVPVRRKKTIKF